MIASWIVPLTLFISSDFIKMIIQIKSASKNVSSKNIDNVKQNYAKQFYVYWILLKLVINVTFAHGEIQLPQQNKCLSKLLKENLAKQQIKRNDYATIKFFLRITEKGIE